MEDEGRIREILAGLIAPEKQPGIAQRLLQGIPQAIALLFSQDPARDLQAQLSERQAIAEREKERRDRINFLGAQLQIEDILQRGRERRSEEAAIRAETRAETRTIAGEAREETRDIARFNRESGFQEKLSNINFKQNKDLALINFGYQEDLARINQGYNLALEKLRSSNNITEQKIGQELGFVLPLLYSGHFSGKNAAEIYDKIARGEKLTPEEDKLISKASKSLRDEKYRQELAIANANRSSASGASLYQKAAEWALTRAGATDLGADAQGNVFELTKDMLGNLTGPPGVQITKYLNEDEQFKYYLERNPIGSVSGNINQNQGQITSDSDKLVKVEDLVKTALNSKDDQGNQLTFENVRNKFMDQATLQKLGITPQQMQDILIKVQPKEAQMSEQKRLEDLEMKIGVKGGTKEEKAEIERIRTTTEETRKKAAAANKINELVENLRSMREIVRREGNLSPAGAEASSKVRKIEKELRELIKQNPALDPFK